MLTLYGSEINSRLLLGTARYPSPAVLSEAVRQSATEIVTVSLRREMSGDLNPSTGPVLVRVFRCIFLAGKGTEDDEGIAVFGRPEGVHPEAG